mmetsp:Transcript_62096/g.103102  ORF Transcript_62096/g.103102 Transcript_62096/m.103102 type:complete len:199 (-) Transcript_62096:375-971(-)
MLHSLSTRQSVSPRPRQQPELPPKRSTAKKSGWCDTRQMHLTEVTQSLFMTTVLQPVQRDCRQAEYFVAHLNALPPSKDKHQGIARGIMDCVQPTFGALQPMPLYNPLSTRPIYCNRPLAVTKQAQCGSALSGHSSIVYCKAGITMSLAQASAPTPHFLPRRPAEAVTRLQYSICVDLTPCFVMVFSPETVCQEMVSP